MGSQNWILYVTDGCETERAVPLSSTRALAIGRASSSGLRLKAPGVSRNHALLDWHLGRPFLTDLGSTNGTRVGKDIVRAPRELRSGDTIYLADAKLRIVALDVSDPRPATTPLASVPRASNPPVKADTRGTLPTHFNDRAPGTMTVWRQRSKTLILAAGALAAAVLGVVNLWDRIFPPDLADVAEIESVHLIKQMTLADFVSVGLRQQPSLRPAAMAADGSGFETPTVTSETSALTRVREEITLPAPRTPAEITYSPGSTPSATTSTPSGTATTSPQYPTHEASSPGTTSSTPPLSPSDKGTTTGAEGEYMNSRAFGGDKAPQDSQAEAACGQEPLKDIETSACETVIDQTETRVNDKGDLVSPPELAAVLSKALSEVEMSESEQGKDPVGWTLAVRLDLEGVANVPLLLTWSLDGLDIPETWRAENLAYRVTATTPRDAGIADIWIPDLARPGTYNVNLKLSFASNGLIADRKQLEVDNY